MYLFPSAKSNVFMLLRLGGSERSVNQVAMMNCRCLCLALALQGLVFVLLTPVSANSLGKAQPAPEATGASLTVSSASWLQHRREKPALQGWELLQPP